MGYRIMPRRAVVDTIHHISMPSDDEATRTRHRRTYRACLACRSAKLRCDLGSVDAPSDPPCRRCRRTGRKCEFAQSYQRNATNASASASASSSRSERPAPIRIRPERIPSPQPSASTSIQPPGDVAPRLDFVYGRNLETPADALRLLCSVADENRELGPSGEQRAATPDAAGGGDGWNRWTPVREGLLTSTEAAALVQL
jgi:hypothetical protein